MKIRTALLTAAGVFALGACAQKEEPVAAAPPPGAVPGSTAADRDGDGIVDGYYTSDGIYHPNVAPAPPPQQMASRSGERG